MEAMSEPIHIAVTRRVKKSHIAEFERALAEFASQGGALPASSSGLRVDGIWHHAQLRQHR
jgi:hypothetical protein